MARRASTRSSSRNGAAKRAPQTPRTAKRSRRDEALAALEQFIDVLGDSRTRSSDALRRAAALRQRRSKGETWTDIVQDEKRPLLVEMATEHLAALQQAGGRFRRAQARALHEEGFTMSEIARLFGVTRQRVSALLRASANGDGE